MGPVVNVYRLGKIPYRSALNIQQVLFKNLKSIVSSVKSPIGGCLAKHNDNLIDLSASGVVHQTDKCASVNELSANFHPGNSLLLLEHEPVYTVGIRSRQYDHKYVLQLKEKLVENNQQAEFVETNRGGLITFHGPGQLVAYPIINLAEFATSTPKKSLKVFVKNLENSIITTLNRIGLKNAHTIPEYPGVWLDGGNRKIAFVGISCKRFVTMHGISINCDCDLTWFDHIASCGIEDKMITSIRQELIGIYPPSKELSHIEYSNYTVHHVAQEFCSSFAEHFDCELKEFPKARVQNECLS